MASLDGKDTVNVLGSASASSGGSAHFSSEYDLLPLSRDDDLDIGGTLILERSLVIDSTSASAVSKLDSSQVESWVLMDDELDGNTCTSPPVIFTGMAVDLSFTGTRIPSIIGKSK